MCGMYVLILCVILSRNKSFDYKKQNLDNKIWWSQIKITFLQIIFFPHCSYI